MESKTGHNLRRRMIQNFMDIIILKHLKSNNAVSGYDIIKHHQKFQMLPSPGTVYSILYALERQELIEGKMAQGKRVYALTNQGEAFLNQIHNTKQNIQAVFSALI